MNSHGVSGPDQYVLINGKYVNVEPKMCLAEEYPKELQRLRDLISVYESLGNVGGFGAACHKITLAQAEKALAEQDTVAMVRAFASMRGAN